MTVAISLRRQIRALPITAGLGAALLLLALYGRIMGYDLRRDELMFVPPAALLDQYRLYRDIFFNHVPYSAWLFDLAHRLLPGLGLLMAARLTVFAAWLALLGTAIWVGWRIGGSVLIGLVGALFLLSNETLLGQTGMAATNNLLPLPFALAGLGLFAQALVERRPGFAPLFLSGLLLAVAAGLKASAIAFIPPVAIACFILPRAATLAERASLLALPVALGGLAGAAPMIWLAVTEPALFFAHIVGYHAGPHVAWWQANMAAEPDLALGLGARVMLAQQIWLGGAALVVLFLTGLALRLARPGAATLSALIVVGAAMALSALLAMLPDPGFPQYYVPPLICLPLLLALAWRELPHGAAATMPQAAMVGAALMLVLAAPRLALGLADLRHAPTPLRVAQGGQALADLMAESGLAGGRVATLAPLYPLEAGLPIYPEFSAGPFAYRVVPYTEPDLRAHYVMAGPDDLPALFARSRPAAILTGFDPALDAPFEAWARTQNYIPHQIAAIRDRYGDGIAWLAPTNSEEGDSR